MPHIVQQHRFFQVILLLCIFEWYLDMNFLPHSAQGFRFSLALLFIWLYIWLQSTVILIFPSMNLYVAICVVCGVWCGVWLYIPHFILVARNNMLFQYIFYVALPVTFFTFFLILQVFFSSILTAMTSQQRSKWSCLKHLKSPLWQCFICICCVNPVSGKFVQLHWSKLNFFSNHPPSGFL